MDRRKAVPCNHLPSQYSTAGFAGAATGFVADSGPPGSPEPTSQALVALALALALASLLLTRRKDRTSWEISRPALPARPGPEPSVARIAGRAICINTLRRLPMNVSRTTASTLALAALAQWTGAMWLAFPLAAHADGYSSAEEARAHCEKLGRAGTPADLKKCCGDYILVASLKEQKKLEAQCAAPKAAANPPKAASATQ